IWGHLDIRYNTSQSIHYNITIIYRYFKLIRRNFTKKFDTPFYPDGYFSRKNNNVPIGWNIINFNGQAFKIHIYNFLNIKEEDSRIIIIGDSRHMGER